MVPDVSNLDHLPRLVQMEEESKEGLIEDEAFGGEDRDTDKVLEMAEYAEIIIEEMIE